MRKQVELHEAAIYKYLVGMSEMLDTMDTEKLIVEFKNEIDSMKIELHKKDSIISLLKE